jgi:hypothetical protein
MDKSPIFSRIALLIIIIQVCYIMSCGTACEQKPLCALNIGKESAPIYILIDTSLLPKPNIREIILPNREDLNFNKCVILEYWFDDFKSHYNLKIFESFVFDSSNVQDYEESNKTYFEKWYNFYSKQINPYWADEYPYKYMDSIAGGLFTYSFDPKEGYPGWYITIDYQKRVSLNQSLDLKLQVNNSSFKQQDSLNFIRFLETIEFLEPGDTNICKCFDDGVL